jgi:hypothetical protein
VKAIYFSALTIWRLTKPREPQVRRIRSLYNKRVLLYTVSMTILFFSFAGCKPLPPRPAPVPATDLSNVEASLNNLVGIQLDEAKSLVDINQIEWAVLKAQVENKRLQSLLDEKLDRIEEKQSSPSQCTCNGGCKTHCNNSLHKGKK